MSEALGEARIIIRPDTTLFRAQLEEQLAFAKKPVVVPVTAAATGAGGEIAGIQAVSKARGEETKAAAAAARQTSQLERGVVRTTLSQFGLAGATLTASGAFIGAAAATLALTRTLKGSVDAAENLQIQTERLVGTTDSLTNVRVQAWAAGLATSFGIARDQGVQFVATLEGLFHNFNITGNRATDMSERLVQLAADMAAFKGQGATTTEALTALQRGLAGNARFLRTFNVFLDASRVSQEALIETGKKQVSNLTRQELITARYNLILQDTANQTDAFRERSANLAEQQRILSANIRNLEINIGGPLVRALNFAATSANNLFFAFEKAKVGAHDLATEVNKIPAGGFLTSHFKDFLNVAAFTNPIGIEIQSFRLFNKAVSAIRGGADSAAQGARDLSGGLGELAADARGVVGPLNAAANAVRGLNQAQIAGQLQQQKTAVSRAQAFGGTGLPELETELARIDRVIAKARRTGTKGPALQGLFDERRSVIDQIRTINTTAASDAKSAADKAKSARDKADQAIIDSIGAGETKLTDQLIGAGIKRQIEIEKQIARFYKAAIARVRKNVKDAKTAADEIRTLTTDFLNAQNTLKDLQKQRTDAVAAAIQQARDDRLAHLEALLSIAETTPGTRDDARRLRAIEKFDRARIAALKAKGKLTREEKIELDNLRVDLAQREKALRDLKAQQDKNKNAAQDLFFSFLQAQQGFAANLLGNLIPGGATGGLVGNTSTSSTPSGLRQVSGGFEEPRGALSQRAAIAGAPTGPSSGQASTTNELLRRILRTLEHLNTRTNHPEAARQRQTMNAAMDGVHGN